MHTLLRIFSLFTALVIAACSASKPSNNQISTPQSDPMKPKTVMNIAHRGARSLAPENTLAAARKAVEVGADMWELDVGMTKDNEMVVIHDDTLERTSNAATVYPDRKPWSVHTFTLEELRKLDFGSWYITQDPFKQIAAKAVTEKELETYKGEPIPTLRQALEFTRDNKWRVNVEIKDLTGKPGDGIVVEKVVALIGELGLDESVIISSFNHSYIQRVKKINPKISTAALVEKVEMDVTGLLERTGAQAYNPSAKVVIMDQIPQIRAKGFDVYVWTVNDETTMRAFIKNEVSGIITDYPQLLKQIKASLK